MRPSLTSVDALDGLTTKDTAAWCFLYLETLADGCSIAEMTVDEATNNPALQHAAYVSTDIQQLVGRDSAALARMVLFSLQRERKSLMSRIVAATQRIQELEVGCIQDVISTIPPQDVQARVFLYLVFLSANIVPC